MRSWQLAFLVVACLAAAGCRTVPAIALLEQENRELEGRLYEVAGLLEECRQENSRLRQRLERYQAEAEAEKAEPQPEAEAPPPEPELPAPDSARTPVRARSPIVQMPSQGISGEEFLERFSNRSRLPVPEELPAPPPEETGADQGAMLWAPAQAAAGARPPVPESPPEAVPCDADNTRVAALTLDDRLTGGYDLDGQAGHEGIVAVIQPRDAQGQPIAAAGAVSVVVLDPALPGQAARVARWDFTAQQIAERYRRTPLAEGIFLELVWPGALPTHSRLHLFVRYVNDRGEKVEVDRPIQIEVPTLQARRPATRPKKEPISKANPPAAGWQRSQLPASAAPTAPLPPPQVARLPHVEASPPRVSQPAAAWQASPSPSPAPPPSTPASSSAVPSRARPTWSPDRP